MLTASEIAELDRITAVIDNLEQRLKDVRTAIQTRIAPEPRKPREFWLQWDVDGQLIARTRPVTQFGQVLHVREVLPDL